MQFDGKDVCKSLPAIVLEFAKIIDKAGAFFGTTEVRSRLLTYLDMDQVWAQIAEFARTDDDLPVDFLYECVWLPGRWQRLCKTPSKVIERHLNGIADNAESLAQSLSAHADEIYFRTGFPVATLDVLLRAYRSSEDTTDNDLYPEVLRSYFRGPKFGVAEIPSIPELLLALSAEIRSAPLWAHTRVRPTRPNAGNAEKTYITRSLVEFFWDRVEKPCYDLAARTVNTILDLADDSMDAAYAKGLARDL